MKVPQHTQDTECSTVNNAPSTSRRCQVIEQVALSAANSSEIVGPTTGIVEPEPISELSTGSGNQITGGVVARLLSNSIATREIIIGFVIFAVMMSGFIGYRVYKRKKKFG